MTEKYVNKKWVDSKMKYDPLYLFENKPEKFKKFLRKRMGDDSTHATVSEKITNKNQNPPVLSKAMSAPVDVAKPKIEMADLINFSSPETFEEF